MPIRVNLPGGITMDVNDPQEAVLLYKGLSESQPAVAPAPPRRSPQEETAARPAVSSVAEKQGWDGLLDTLSREGRQLLEVLRTHDAVTLDELRQLLNAASNNQAAGFLTGVQKKAQKVGLSMADIYRREERISNGVRTTVFVAGPLLKSSGALT